MSSTCVQFSVLDICEFIIPPQNELPTDPHTVVTDTHRNLFIGEEGASGRNRPVGVTKSSITERLPKPFRL